jgi:16S rRNA processing protein RimM
MVMNISDCFYLGKITKSFGFKGEVCLFLDVNNIEEYAELDGVYIDINSHLVFYDIESLRFSENKVIVRFSDTSYDDTLALIGKEMYLPLSMLPKLEGNKFYFHEVIGFKVIDTEKGEIGILKEVIDYPAQPLLIVWLDEKEILIPLIDKIIEKLDREHKIMYINAPAGLIDLYLS